MPNFDTGHYFLTTLAPVRDGTVREPGGMDVSFQQNLRLQLATLPTALQSPATIRTGVNSPFADNHQTHLCRFVVLDDVVFNGRQRTNTLVNSILGRDPINPEPVDRLNCAYLMFAADIDAVTEAGAPLPRELTPDQQNAVRDAYARQLWSTMEGDLRRIYENCVGFEDVNSADDFARYLRRCQVETTMPFNDYWISAPALSPLPLWPIAVGVLVPLIVCLLGLGSLLAGADQTWLLHRLVDWSPTGTFWGGLLVTGLAIFAAYRFVMWKGAQPMPPGAYADLPTVLKSLYLQQTFSDFAVAQQGVTDADLHAAFGAYLKEHRPEDRAAPTQHPGVISIRQPGAIIR